MDTLKNISLFQYISMLSTAMAAFSAVMLTGGTADKAISAALAALAVALTHLVQQSPLKSTNAPA